MRRLALLLILTGMPGCAQTETVKLPVAISERAAAARAEHAPPYVLTLEGVRAPEDRGITLRIYGETPAKEAVVIGTASTMGWLGGKAEGPPRTVVIPLNPEAAKYVEGKRQAHFWVVGEDAKIRVDRASLDVSSR